MIDIKFFSESFLNPVISEELLNKLKNIEESMNELDEFAYKQINGHPWELIYKYLALIMRSFDCECIAEQYISTVAQWKNKYKGIIGKIVVQCCKYGDKEWCKCENEVGKYTYMYY